MKNILYLAPVYFQIRYNLLAILFVGLITPTYAQTGEDETKQEMQSDTSGTEEEPTSEKMALRMSFEAFKINQELKLLARIMSKVKAKFQNTAGVEVSFYKEEISPENLIGLDTSNRKGESYWLLLPEEKSDSASSATYWAVVRDHPDYEDVEETVSVNPSIVDMKLEEEDSSHVVKIFVGHPDESGQTVPLADVECNVYVKRLFGVLPILETETTDEEGNITVEFLREIQGDESGNLTVVAKIAEHEILGNVEVSKTIAWGIPSKVNDFYQQRELWSARANSPLMLIFVVNATLLGIWGVIAFIFLEIFRINKLGKTN